jgi:hypothetical protein
VISDNAHRAVALACLLVMPAIGLAVAITACAPTVKPAAPQVVVTGCTAFPRLTASRQDTAETRQAILAYVTTWDALCAPATGAKP